MHLTLTSLPHKLHRWLRIERRAGLRNQPVTLHRRRIFILPTRYGMLFALLTFVMVLGSTNYNNSAGFLLSFLLIGIGMVSMLHTYRNLARLSFRAGRAEPVFCGDPARFQIFIDNTDGAPRSALALRFNDQTPLFLDIPAADHSVAAVETPTRRRGHQAMERLTVFTCYPLGLFRAWSHVTFDVSCLVYPRPASVFAPAAKAVDEGGTQQGQTPGNDDFLGYREYHHGDSPRHVDWKAAARGEELLTKLFADNESDELWLDWDRQTARETEARLSSLCRGVLWAEGTGRRYGLRLPDQTIPLGSGEGHKHRCLEALALFKGTPI